MIENNKKTIHNLKNIKEKLNAESAHIIYTDATRYIKTIDISQIDLIMLDPPFESNYIENIVPYIYQKKTSKDLLLYVEYYKPIRYSGLFQTLYRSRAGKVYFSLLKKI